MSKRKEIAQTEWGIKWADQEAPHMIETCHDLEHAVVRSRFMANYLDSKVVIYKNGYEFMRINPGEPEFCTFCGRSPATHRTSEGDDVCEGCCIGFERGMNGEVWNVCPTCHANLYEQELIYDAEKGQQCQECGEWSTEMVSSDDVGITSVEPLQNLQQLPQNSDD